MTEAATATAEERSSARVTLHRLRHLTSALWERLELVDLATGHWFTKVVEGYLKHYEAHRMHEEARAFGTRAEDTDAIIRRACIESSLAGAVTASTSTGATVIAAETGIPGALAGLSASGALLTLEMLVRSLIRLRMTCDLASTFGVRFRADDPGDVTRLYALTVGTVERGDSEEGGRDLGRVQRVTEAASSDLGDALGSKLLGASFWRNAVPFLNVVSSSLTGWVRTRHLGETVLHYVRFRRALDDAFAEVARRWSPGGELLIEGAWFLFTSDGRLGNSETAVLAHLLNRHGPPVRERLQARMVDDDLSWLDRLRAVPKRVREPFFHALQVMATANLEVPPGEFRELRHAALALDLPFESQHLDHLMEQFRARGVVPVPTFAGVLETAAPRVPRRRRPEPAQPPSVH